MLTRQTELICLSEWESESASVALIERLATPTAQAVTGNGTAVELRQWKLMKAWPNTARQPSRRLKPSYPAPGTSDIGDRIRARRGNRGLTDLDGSLLNAPEIANGWNTLLGAVRTKNSLPGHVRELLVGTS